MNDTHLFEQAFEQINQNASSATEAIRVTELIIIMFDLQAGRAQSALDSLHRLYPQEESGFAYKTIVEPTRLNLQVEVQQASQHARIYRNRLRQLLHMHPDLAPHPWPRPGDALHAYDHFTYPLGTLLQTLPADITNQSSLTPEQRSMCDSVAALAWQAQETLLDGVEGLGTLLNLASKQLDASTQLALGRLLKYLTREARFMLQNAAEYAAAARNVRPAAG